MLAPFENYSSTPMSMEVDRDGAVNINVGGMHASAHPHPHPATPPRRTGRTKRARSPPSSPSVPERPTKRMFSAHRTPSAKCARTAHQAAPWYTDDWVSRTQGLSIAKDEGCGESLLYAAAAAESVDMDENMTIDNEDVPREPVPPPNSPMQVATGHIVQPCPSQDSFSLSHLQSHILHSTHLPSSPGSLSPSEFSTSASQPGFALQQAHLSHMQDHAGAATGYVGLSPPLPDLSMPMTAPQSLPLLSCPLSPRKQRFTMGPRADCEKCRQGVPGHYVHFD